jgi:hypothetical protein
MNETTKRELTITQSFECIIITARRYDKNRTMFIRHELLLHDAIYREEEPSPASSAGAASSAAAAASSAAAAASSAAGAAAPSPVASSAAGAASSAAGAASSADAPASLQRGG